MTPKTQSLCKLCQQPKGDLVHSRWAAPELHHEFEPVAEPASTGEPPPQCSKCGGNLVASPTVHCPKCASTNFLIPAARPSEPPTKACDWPFEGCCTQKEACIQANRCLKNLPSAPQTSAVVITNETAMPQASGAIWLKGQASPKEVAEQSAEPKDSILAADLLKAAGHTCKPETCGCWCRTSYSTEWEPVIYRGQMGSSPECKCKPDCKAAAPQPVAGEGAQEWTTADRDAFTFLSAHEWQAYKAKRWPAAGTPKLEEIALDHAGHCVVCRRAIRCEYKHVKSGHDETCVVGKILSALRSFIPASTTPETCKCVGYLAGDSFATSTGLCPIHAEGNNIGAEANNSQTKTREIAPEGKSKGKLRKEIRYLKDRIEVLEAEIFVARAPEHMRARQIPQPYANSADVTLNYTPICGRATPASTGEPEDKNDN